MFNTYKLKMIFSRDKQTAEQKFWQWFEANSARLMNFESNQEATFDELNHQLNHVNNDLTFEFGPIINGKREFVVTADGIKAAFPAVEALVQAAPTFDDWTIVAFRQPQGTNFIIEMDGQKIGADDIWFATEPDGDKTGLYLFIKGLTPENENTLGQASFILLDAALGNIRWKRELDLLKGNLYRRTLNWLALCHFE